ncbi:MAG: hypothetical protein K2N78_03155, partial [Oscillospiraceae bacterium]|nr:hypothetical protein [Oscillospiraceae bacterium]
CPAFLCRYSTFRTVGLLENPAFLVKPPKFQNLPNFPKKSPPWGDFTLAFLARFCYDKGNVL